MNLAQVTNAAIALGIKADELSFALDHYGDLVPEEKRKKWEEVRDAMVQGEKAIHNLLEQRDNLSAYIFNEKRNIDYNRQLVEKTLNIGNG
ncbi:MAG: hypothetical protein CMI60_08150 [Parvibaculum sp.]|nr:hypothetical protein [Parvibaculum sp.]